MTIENPTGLMPGTLLALQYEGIINTLAQVTRETNTRLYVKDVQRLDFAKRFGAYYSDYHGDGEYYLTKSNAAQNGGSESLANKLFCVVGDQSDFDRLAAASKQHWLRREALEHQVAAARDAAADAYDQAVEEYIEELNDLLDVNLAPNPPSDFGIGRGFQLRFASFSENREGLQTKWRKFDRTGATVHRPAPPASTIEQEPTRDASDLFSMAQPG